MGVYRLIAIGVIFASVSAAWLVLGRTVQTRTHDLDRSLSAEMDNLWGPKVLVQVARSWAPPARPAAAAGPVQGPSAGTITPSVSRVCADIHLDQRYKGLLWYSTFTVKFSAAYTVPPAASTAPDAAGKSSSGCQPGDRLRRSTGPHR